MTTVGGIGHTLPFLIPGFQFALGVAMVVVLLELGIISWVRHRFMDTPVFSAAMQVGLGGALVFIPAILIGRRRKLPKRNSRGYGGTVARGPESPPRSDR